MHDSSINVDTTSYDWQPILPEIDAIILFQLRKKQDIHEEKNKNKILNQFTNSQSIVARGRAILTSHQHFRHLNKK